MESSEPTVRRRHKFLTSLGRGCPDDGLAEHLGLGYSIHHCRACVSRKLRYKQTVLGNRVHLDNTGDCCLRWSRKLHSIQPVPGIAHLPFRTHRVSVRRWSLRNVGVPNRILPVSGRRHTDSIRGHLPPNFPSDEGSCCPAPFFPGYKVLFQLRERSTGRRKVL